MLTIINQIHEIQSKLQGNPDYQKHFDRIYHELNESGYIVYSPINETYNENDTSIEVLFREENQQIIKKVVKPAVYKLENGQKTLLQKAVVLIEK